MSPNQSLALGISTGTVPTFLVSHADVMTTFVHAMKILNFIQGCQVRISVLAPNILNVLSFSLDSPRKCRVSALN
jgi:hypothetical protein